MIIVTLNNLHISNSAEWQEFSCPACCTSNVTWTLGQAQYSCLSTASCMQVLIATSPCCCPRHITQAQARYGGYFHRVLFSGTLQRQQRTHVTLRRVTLISLDRLLLHQQEAGPARGTSSPRSPMKHGDAAVDTFFLCVYSADRIVWHGTTAVEVCLLWLLIARSAAFWVVIERSQGIEDCVFCAFTCL